jgi:hypothetical protein
MIKQRSYVLSAVKPVAANWRHSERLDWAADPVTCSRPQGMREIALKERLVAFA